MSEQDFGESSLVEHLVELRGRLVRALLGLGVALLALLPFTQKLYNALAEPLVSQLPNGQTMIATNPAGAFFAPLKLTFFVALFVAVPWLLYQLWAFVAPGLYAREKRLAVPLLVSSVLLFYTGCAFAYFLVLPAVFHFLTTFSPDVIDHAGCERLPGFRAGDLLRLRRQFRTAGGDGDPGAAGLGDAAAVQGRPRLRDRRHLRAGGGADPAGRGLAADAGDPDVPAVRAGHPRRPLAGAVVGSEEARRLKKGTEGLSRLCHCAANDLIPSVPFFRQAWKTSLEVGVVGIGGAARLPRCTNICFQAA
jgi:hypothetical protein